MAAILIEELLGVNVSARMVGGQIFRNRNKFAGLMRESGSWLSSSADVREDMRIQSCLPGNSVDGFYAMAGCKTPDQVADRGSGQTFLCLAVEKKRKYLHILHAMMAKDAGPRLQGCTYISKRGSDSTRSSHEPSG